MKWLGGAIISGKRLMTNRPVEQSIKKSMKPLSIRERLHAFIDATVAALCNGHLFISFQKLVQRLREFVVEVAFGVESVDGLAIDFALLVQDDDRRNLIHAKLL